MPEGRAFVWGPAPCFLADEKTSRPVADDRVVKINTGKVEPAA